MTKAQAEKRERDNMLALFPGLMEAAENVVENWEKGDLAGAVRHLAWQVALAKGESTSPRITPKPNVLEALIAILPFAEDEAMALRDNADSEDEDAVAHAQRAMDALHNAEDIIADCQGVDRLDRSPPLNVKDWLIQEGM